MDKKKYISLSPTQFIALGFFITIIAGTLLLMLPISAKNGQVTPFLDALFMATSSVCVTGLSLVNVYEYWTIFGQIVILILIQLGGLGIVAITMCAFLLLKKKVTLKDRLLIQESYSLNSTSGMVALVMKIVKGTFFVEMVGAILFAFAFIPDYGLVRGSWISFFTAISAFCNAGIDILGGNSLMAYAANPLVNFTAMMMIVSGGIGYVVWWDLIKVCKLMKKQEKGIRFGFRKCNLHTKIVLTMTLSLIFGGAILLLLFEYNNEQTIGNMPFIQKCMASLFQSVTTRTAGFATISQAGLRDGSALLCIVLMFIGGSPVGTAGGVKTITIAMIFLCVVSVVRGEKETTVYGRTIPADTTRKALAVFAISLIFLLSMTVALSIAQKADFMSIFYETTSALATVGLSRDFTSSLNQIGKSIIIFMMYIGRIGPITMVVAFRMKGRKKTAQMRYPTEDIIVG